MKKEIINISDYKLVSRDFFGKRLKLYFQKIDDEKDVKVLDMQGIYAFFDYKRSGNKLDHIELRERIGRLCITIKFTAAWKELSEKQRKNLFDIKDVIIHKLNEEGRAVRAFRAGAEEIEFRDYDKKNDLLRL